MPTDILAACRERWADEPPPTNEELEQSLEHACAAPYCNRDRLVATVLTQREEIGQLRDDFEVMSADWGYMKRQLATAHEEIQLCTRHARTFEWGTSLEKELQLAKAECDRLHALIAAGHTHEWGPVGKRTAVCNWCPTHQTWPAPVPTEELAP